MSKSAKVVLGRVPLKSIVPQFEGALRRRHASTPSICHQSSAFFPAGHVTPTRETTSPGPIAGAFAREGFETGRWLQKLQIRATLAWLLRLPVDGIEHGKLRLFH